MAKPKKTAAPIEPIRIEVSDSARILHLEGVLSVALAQQLHSFAQELARPGPTVAVRADHLRHLDGAAAQVLLALRETLHQQGITFAFQNPSESVQSTLRIAGLGNAFAPTGAGD